jgi:DNA-binding beta-propeller fold protein YncE
VAVDGQGNLFVADSDGNRIQELSATGQPRAQWSGSGSAPGQFNAPFGVAANAEGKVYVADSKNKRVQVLESR